MTTHHKLICVVGATGNQGGSVARRFRRAGFRVRGLTRNPDSASARQLAAEGIEPVAADLDDVASVTEAVRGANVIFSVTNYWEPFLRPDCRREADAAGISCRRYAYDVEYRHGKNIADAAAATVDTLDPNGFLASTLSHAGKCSKGAFTELYHFDAKADIFPFYVRHRHPDLAAKMSCIQTGFFYTSFNILPNSYFSKQSDGSFQMAFTTAPDRPVPHLDPVGDMGNFTYAVYQMPPGKDYMAEGVTCTWAEWIRTWGEVTGKPASYRQVSTQDMIEAAGDRELGIEVASMFSYSTDPGYDGGMSVLTAHDVRAAGIDCPMTSFKEWAMRYDWSTILEDGK